MEKEIWLPIKSHKRYYEVSSLGRIRNKATGKMLTKTVFSNGYSYVKLSYIKRKNYKVNRLVAVAHVPNPFKGRICNHRNYIKTDDRASNLEWISQKRNVRHSTIRMYFRTREEKLSVIEVWLLTNKITKEDLLKLL